MNKTERAALTKAAEPKGNEQPGGANDALVEKGLLVWESFGTRQARLVPSATARLLLMGADADEVDLVAHGTGKPGSQSDTAGKTLAATS